LQRTMGYIPENVKTSCGIFPPKRNIAKILH
jgi:hypothetical protein